MIKPTEIVSLTDFKRDTAAHLKRLKKHGVQVLTVNGKSVAVALDPKTYEKWAAAIDRAEAVAGIREGLEQMKAGGGLPIDAAIAKARAKAARRMRRIA